MDSTQIKQIIAKIKSGSFDPVYFLHGTEAYYIDLISDTIEEHALTEDEKAFNQMVAYGKDINMMDIISQAKSFPMGADRQVIILKEAQEIKDFGPLESYLDQVQPSTILVVCHKYKKLDKRKALYKKLSKQATLVETKELYDNQVPDWIISFTKSKGHPISNKAAALLSEYLGNDLSKIANEIEKLSLNIPASSEINTEIIEKFVGISKDFNNFELLDAIASRNHQKAYQIVLYFAANPKNHPIILTLITLYGFFAKVMLIYFLKDKSFKGIMAGAGLNGYNVKSHELASRNYSSKQVSKILSVIKETDMKAKGLNNTSSSSEDLLKELIYKILHS